MKPKYTKVQKVKIVSVKNQHGNLKYPKIEQYVNETGVIVDSVFVEGSKLPGLEDYPPAGKYGGYTVRLDKDNAEVIVGEDALVALDE